MADAPKPGEGIDGGGHPVIDPTKNVLDLVRAAMERQDDLRGANKGLFEAIIHGLEKYIDATIEGRVALTNSRFDAVEAEFGKIENRRIEQKNDTKIAVDAAFTAAKDAVREQATSSEKSIDKSDKATADQIKQNAQTFSAQLNGFEGTLGDLKERLGKLETQREAKIETHSESRSNVGMIAVIVSSVIAFLSLILAAVAIIGARP